MPAEDEDSVDADKLDPAEVIGPPRGLIRSSERLLSQVEQMGPNLTPKECLDLFDSVAVLKFTDWDKVTILWTDERRGKVAEATRGLYTRLRGLMGSHPAALLDPLDAGIRSRVEDITQAYLYHEEVRTTYAEPWDANTSYEFIDQVIHPLDTIGYILELLRDLGIEVRAETSMSITTLDTKLRPWLPKVAEEFRRGNDSIDPTDPDLFPDSFWWRRLPGARPILP